MFGSASGKALVLGGLAVAAMVAAAEPAAARGFVRFGIGVPLGPVYYPPPPVYYGPPVAYAPPPVVYAPEPFVAGAAPADRQCREYQTTSTVDGQQQQIYGTACLQPDGTWRIVR